MGPDNIPAPVNRKQDYLHLCHSNTEESATRKHRYQRASLPGRAGDPHKKKHREESLADLKAIVDRAYLHLEEKVGE